MTSLDSNVQSSRVFDATLAVTDRLNEIVWPAHPVTGEAPKVSLSWDPSEFYREWIVISTLDQGETSVAWAERIGDKDETIRTDIILHTDRTAGSHPDGDQADERAVVERAQVLAELVQSIARRNDPGPGIKRIGFPNETAAPRVAGVRYAVERTEQLVMCRAVISFELYGQF